MKKAALIAIAVMVSCPAAAQTIPWDVSPAKVRHDSAAHCADLIPESLSVQVRCREMAHDGAAEFAAIARRHLQNRRMMVALDHCYRLFTENGLVNFGLLGTCARQQETALHQLDD